ncbi:hypothetical protein F0562_000295 [Nyssa sinensis]|uniref:Alpha/beta hydrolase fold-3 domain-containing protein n=1 Tax=Nyssa sinensis TaxID=561372 RepID=A0A5J5C4T1_9ASTE|nr:hypothetical protein F0562_000295 [Nyssa sinensis]
MKTMTFCYLMSYFDTIHNPQIDLWMASKTVLEIELLQIAAQCLMIDFLTPSWLTHTTPRVYKDALVKELLGLRHYLQIRLCVNLLVSQAKVLAVSVEYVLAPQHPLPTTYEGCSAALPWVSFESVRNGVNKLPQLIGHGDFDLDGDGAGLILRISNPHFRGTSRSGFAISGLDV